MSHRRTPAEWSRRDLMRLAATAIALPAIAAGCARDLDDDSPVSASQRALRQSGLVPDGEAATRLGKLYRDRHPDQRSIDELCRALGGDSLPSTPAQWREAAARGLRSDLDAGRTLELDGWTLTLTEARLLALASLN